MVTDKIFFFYSLFVYVSYLANANKRPVVHDCWDDPNVEHRQHNMVCMEA